jgi:signal transduction histidine kinase
MSTRIGVGCRTRAARGDSRRLDSNEMAPDTPSDLERADAATAALAQLIATTEEFQRRALSAESLARATQRESRQANERLAHSLHDTVAQSLVSAHRFLEAARASTAASRPDRAAEQLDAAQAAVLEAIRDLRRVIDDLAPTGA